MAEGFPQFPPRTALPNLTLHESTIRDEVDAGAVAQKWLSCLVKSITGKDGDAFRGLFFEKSWWRDFVGFSWTITSKNGPAAISDLVLGSEATLKHAAIPSSSPALSPTLTDMGPMTMIMFGYEFTTQYGSGRGIIRLGNDGPDSWKAWTVSSQLNSLGDESAPTTNGASSDSNEYQVLIVGAGQSGLMLGAWLKKLGVSYLIVDKASRPGDAWRTRYASIQSHTPNYSDHFSFLDFPADYPKWARRDDMANWIDHYGDAMDLSMLPDATVTSVDRDASSHKYTTSVTLSKTSIQKTFTSIHIVLATGIFSPTPIMPSFPGLDTFPGQAYHATHHTSAAAIPDVTRKNIVVVGAGTSAHDIAQDFVAHGANSVTMVQRSAIWSCSTDTCEKFLFTPWNTPGVDTATGDLVGTSMPAAIALTLGAGMAKLMAANDQTMLDGLEKAGMRLDKGDEGISFFDYQLVKLAGFYIDQGACEMIIDGRIKVRYCEGGVTALTDDGVVCLADGTQIPADVVVLATGYEKMTYSMEQILGKELASKADDPCEGLDAETERAGLARPTGVSGLWYMAGGFLLCRQLSQLLGLQIAAIERGINKTHFASS